MTDEPRSTFLNYGRDQDVGLAVAGEKSLAFLKHHPRDHSQSLGSPQLHVPEVMATDL